MSDTTQLEYCRGRWPEADVPAGEPLWLLYELDRAADAVIRTVEVFPDGRVTRNSIALEQREGDLCPSLINGSLAIAFKDAPLEQITKQEFEIYWLQGVDRPFWFMR